MHIHSALLKPPPPPPAATPGNGSYRKAFPLAIGKPSVGVVRRRAPSMLRCKGIQVSDPKEKLSSSIGCSRNGVAKSVGVKEVDVATLGNLCVDIVLNVPQLPPASMEERKKYMDQLSASPPDKSTVHPFWCLTNMRFRYIVKVKVKTAVHVSTIAFSDCIRMNEKYIYFNVYVYKLTIQKNWEAGGSCNMAIAASRLGLSCITIGHVGKEIYGNFLVDVLQNENIGMVGMDKDDNVTNNFSASRETLLCWVLVDPSQRHGFCSRADFCQEPAFSWMSGLSPEVEVAIQQSKTIFCNGYGFDDFSPRLLTAALNYAVEVGTSIFFDPGPRGRSLSVGSLDEQRALDHFLRMSDVLLMTSDEAQSLTGVKDPIQAGKDLLRNGVRTKWVIIKMGARGSVLITTSSISCVPAFKVNVCDTVGCGDSFVAAIAYGYIHKLSKINALTLANAVGAATATGSGAGRNVATLEKVLNIMKGSSLNEDETFWCSLLHEHLDTEDCSLLCKETDNSRRFGHLNHVSLQKVVSELLPKLNSSMSEHSLPSKYIFSR
ncbi:unnamed protein product [Rhodiola kirilowii]